MVAGNHGFTYLGVLFGTALLATGLAKVGEAWEIAAQRDKEAQLLHIGNEYRRAIMLYYESPAGGVRRYPRRLEDLLKDERYPSTRRYLRRLYPDPITGKAEWGIVKAPDGGIMGVFSLGTQAPLKRAGFRLLDAGFGGASAYSSWKFFYAPPGVTPGQPAKPR